jgi:hypothetical protein
VWYGLDQTNDGIFYCMDAKLERVSPPASYARKGSDGFWYVAVTWANGRQQRLGPYKTEADAHERIKAQLDAWHESQKYFRNRLGNIHPR